MGTIARLTLFTALLVGSSASTALATDSSFACTSLSDELFLDDGDTGLELFDAKDASRDYTILRKLALNDREGTCTTPHGQEYGWQFATNVYLIRTEGEDGPIELTFICERASSGQPAGVEDCRATTTKDVRLRAAYAIDASDGYDDGVMPPDIFGTYATEKVCDGSAPFVEIADARIQGENFDCAVGEARPGGTGLVNHKSACVIDGKKIDGNIDLDLGNFSDRFAMALPGRDDWISLYPCPSLRQ